MDNESLSPLSFPLFVPVSGCHVVRPMRSRVLPRSPTCIPPQTEIVGSRFDSGATHTHRPGKTSHVITARAGGVSLPGVQKPPTAKARNGTVDPYTEPCFGRRETPSNTPKTSEKATLTYTPDAYVSLPLGGAKENAKMPNQNPRKKALVYARSAVHEAIMLLSEAKIGGADSPKREQMAARYLRNTYDRLRELANREPDETEGGF